MTTAALIIVDGCANKRHDGSFHGVFRTQKYRFAFATAVATTKVNNCFSAISLRVRRSVCLSVRTFILDDQFYLNPYFAALM